MPWLTRCAETTGGAERCKWAARQIHHARVLVVGAPSAWSSTQTETCVLAASIWVVATLHVLVDHTRLLVGGAPIRRAPRLAEMGSLAAAIRVVTVLPVYADHARLLVGGTPRAWPTSQPQNCGLGAVQTR